MSMSDIAQQVTSINLDIAPIEIPDILHYIFQFSQPLDLLLNVSCVSQFWCELVKSSKSLWLYNCDALWKGKFFINPNAQNIKVSKPVDAFQMSWIDRKRNVITFKELTELKWQLRLKFASSFTKKENEMILCSFLPDHTLIHEPRMGNFRWRFVEEKQNTSGLQRSSRFFGSFLSEFDVNAKNSANNEEEINYGWDHWCARNKKEEEDTNDDEQEYIIKKKYKTDYDELDIQLKFVNKKFNKS
eukprot:129436_1